MPPPARPRPAPCWYTLRSPPITPPSSCSRPPRPTDGDAGRLPTRHRRDERRPRARRRHPRSHPTRTPMRPTSKSASTVTTRSESRDQRQPGSSQSRCPRPQARTTDPEPQPSLPRDQPTSTRTLERRPGCRPSCARTAVPTNDQSRLRARWIAARRLYRRLLAVTVEERAQGDPADDNATAEGQHWDLAAANAVIRRLRTAARANQERSQRGLEHRTGVPELLGARRTVQRGILRPRASCWLVRGRVRPLGGERSDVHEAWCQLPARSHVLPMP